MTVNTLFILAAGRSSRMKRSEAAVLSDSEEYEANYLPKSMIRINGKPFVEYLLLNAEKAGLKNVVFIISPEEKSFENYFGSGEFNGLKISYAYQRIIDGREKPMGTADAIFQALKQKNSINEFLLCNSDNLYSANTMKQLVELKDFNGMIAYDKDYLRFEKERLKNFAFLSLDKSSYLSNIIEKPVEKPGSFENQDTYISMNLYKLRREDIYYYLETCPVNTIRDEKELPTAILNMVQMGHVKLKAVKVKEHVPDLTSKTDIKEVGNQLKGNEA